MRWVALGGLALVCLLWLAFNSPAPTHAENERVITIYHDSVEQTVVTDATTVAEALKRGGINLGDHDAVEPERETTLTAPTYNINIYRARPVTVIDGSARYEVMSAHTSARQIAIDAGLKMRTEDIYELTRIDDFLSEGIGLKLTIHRATSVNLVLYGKQENIYTQAKTVGELIKEKGIVLGKDDGSNLEPSTLITAGLKLEIWRNGVNTITQEEDVAYSIEQIRDADKPTSYRLIKEPGVNGKKVVTYQVELRDGKEVSRTVIQSVVTQQPKRQLEVIGTQAAVADPAANKVLGHALMLSAGFGESQWPCLLDLWERESHWNQYKQNPTSGAYGIPQALPGSKMGPGWNSDPSVQINWGLGYIKGRYGTPCTALNSFMARSPHWY
jgi:uncharacterized protein YabE (DUF348 family)